MNTTETAAKPTSTTKGKPVSKTARKSVRAAARPADAIKLLKDDHKEVKGYFKFQAV